MKKIKTILKKYSWVLIVIVVTMSVRWFYTRDGIKTITVKEITPENRIVEKTVSASGIVKSQNSANLSFNSTGRVSYIGVEKGDDVKAGQLLSGLDTNVAMQNVQYYKDARDVALRNRELFIEEYETNKDAVGGKDEYAITLRKYNELLSQAEAAYQAQSDSIRNSYIYAPFDGVIVDVTKEVGENAAIGETVIKLENLNNIVFEVELDQEDYGLVKLGQKAKVELDAYKGVEFDGNITLLPMYADGKTGTSFVVEISISEQEGHTPLIGMTGDTKVVIEQTNAEVASLFYDQILYDDEDNPYVYVLEGDLIKKQYIEIGLEGDIYTELKAVPNKPIVVGLNDKVEVKEGYKAKVIQ